MLGHVAPASHPAPPPPASSAQSPPRPRPQPPAPLHAVLPMATPAVPARHTHHHHKPSHIRDEPPTAVVVSNIPVLLCAPAALVTPPSLGLSHSTQPPTHSFPSTLCRGPASTPWLHHVASPHALPEPKTAKVRGPRPGPHPAIRTDAPATTSAPAVCRHLLPGSPHTEPRAAGPEPAGCAGGTACSYAHPSARHSACASGIACTHPCPSVCLLLPRPLHPRPRPPDRALCTSPPVSCLRPSAPLLLAPGTASCTYLLDVQALLRSLPHLVEALHPRRPEAHAAEQRLVDGLALPVGCTAQRSAAQHRTAQHSLCLRSRQSHTRQSCQHQHQHCYLCRRAAGDLINQNAKRGERGDSVTQKHPPLLIRCAMPTGDKLLVEAASTRRGVTFAGVVGPDWP